MFTVSLILWIQLITVYQSFDVKCLLITAVINNKKTIANYNTFNTAFHQKLPAMFYTAVLVPSHT